VSPGLSQFEGQQFINLETYRKNGRAVVTPVWFTTDSASNRFFVVTRSETGKVKRIRNNGAVRIMPCGMRGEPKGEWVNAKARLATPEETDAAIKQRSKKYGFKAKIAGFFSSTKGDLVAISITPDSQQ
jgi:PPOX class probable F420-dependent enzyme